MAVAVSFNGWKAHTYLMALFPIPNKVLRQLDKIRRDFLWEGNKGHQLHLVKWSKCTMHWLRWPGDQRFGYTQEHTNEMAMEMCTRRTTTNGKR